jgi:type I site-specific deoxyribonuclease
VIIANPPFMTPKGGIAPHKKFGITSKRAELLFVDYIASHLKPNGRAAVIVPDGVLSNSSSAHKALRKEIVENKKLQAVISMPSGVFKPYAGVSTAILVFANSNNERTDKVWFYDMKIDGYSLDDKRSKLKTSDVPDILARFKNLDGEKDRKRNEQSFFVDKDEIIKNGYDLTINKYKEVEYKKVEYPPTSEIIAEIKKLDREASESLAELEKLLNETNPDL